MSNLLKEVEAARYLRLRPKTLRQWRSIGSGPQYYRVGGSIRYDQKHLEKFLIAKTALNTFMFSYDTITVVGLFNFNENKRHAINEQCDVRTKFIFTVFISQFSDNLKGVLIEVLKIK